jgi:acyl-CoA reductase-like NAD-dependent aldehyde dehydrogenase
MSQQTPEIGGSFAYPAAVRNVPASTIEELDAALQTLQQHKARWVKCPLEERMAYLEIMIHDFAVAAPGWVERVVVAQKLAGNDHAIGYEWVQGPYSLLRNLQCLKSSLRDIRKQGVPRIPGRVTRRRNGQVSARVFPQTLYDRLLFKGYRADVWMEPDVTPGNLRETQALAYRSPDPEGTVSLVLGAGNVSSIPPTDVLDRLLIHNQVVVLKLSPVNDYLGPVFAQGFRCLIEAGYLRIVYGGAGEGAYLCQHPAVEQILITGSDKTFEAIVFGAGEEGRLRKREGRPFLRKPIAGELGNVTPVIVIPGPWSQKDLEYQAEYLATWIAGSASATCNTPRVLILHTEWPQRAAFLDALRQCFAGIPPKHAFYPGSQQRYQTILAAHPDAERIGHHRKEDLAWTLIPEVDIQDRNDICLATESFCSVLAVAPISADGIPEYLERAVEFCNHTLWGTLLAGLVVHPNSLKDASVRAAFEKAIEQLRYGTVSVGAGGLNWCMMTTPWGAFPGSRLSDIQSGNGFVHNTLMFGKPHKTVTWAGFREWPKPITFVSRGKALRELGPLLVDFMAAPRPRKLLPIIRIVLG